MVLVSRDFEKEKKKWVKKKICFEHAVCYVVRRTRLERTKRLSSFDVDEPVATDSGSEGRGRRSATILRSLWLGNCCAITITAHIFDALHMPNAFISQKL